MNSKLPDRRQVRLDVERALAEDLGSGDASAAAIPIDAQARGTVIAREDCVLAGRPWFDETFAALDKSVTLDWLLEDGAEVRAQTTLCRLAGPARALLAGERTALNFLQTLSGVASETHLWARELAGTKTRLLDTRKTLPGLRQAQKYAVRCGGGENHRQGLFDLALLKENHWAFGRPTQLRARIQGAAAIEVENPEQLDEALAAGFSHILLDNFDLAAIRLAVRRNAASKRPAMLEASGGVSRGQLAALAAAGIDAVSAGALTKNIRAIDFSMRLESDS